MPSHSDAPHEEGPADHEGHVPERLEAHHFVHASFRGSDSGECGVAKLGGARGCLVEFDRASEGCGEFVRATEGRGKDPIEGQVPEREGTWSLNASSLDLACAIDEP